MKRNIKLFLLIIAVIMLFSLTSCGSEGKNSGDKTRIALLLSGNLGDMSFLDSAKKGTDEILSKYDDVEVRVIEMGSDATKYETNVLDFSDDGYDIIIGSGWQLQEPFQNIAENYPDTTYILFDASVDYEKSEYSNVYSITYKVNEASYLAGILAAGMSNTEVIGFLGGADGPGINDFLVGYIEGAKSVNKDIKVIVGYIGSFSDSPKAKEMALAQYNQGADIIFTAAGSSGIGTLEAAASQGKYAIGVDSDQALLFEKSNPAISNSIPTSTLKKVDSSLVRAYDLYNEGKLPIGKVENLGLEEDAVSLTDNKFYQDIVPEDIKEKIEVAKQEIIEGKIKVSTAFGISNDDLHSLIESVRP
ncbi:putative ABC-type transport system, periplasmic component/surface lipoprotein [[Clostridium] ultunense Esp]|uniref:Putative ABC-type transport system, periplasmic component/surface lipoprotein n=1 Tax=[Clostridium] ultunense Esp TaxID=1288971 RepID=M1ZFN6_9FIRM|nr:BMP family ABC transporter substrate-binding protein [Schnuerera ultunensis]CCQ96978.1 putative ABC-type transport system, periplasmic component/surface lipoprotein [[Clostridium] ultunense Esp]SHD76465.1 putative ABC-type transport system, periplasmic component/surface lipoprotein [[Clostridium] ultunense Esp]